MASSQLISHPDSPGIVPSIPLHFLHRHASSSAYPRSSTLLFATQLPQPGSHISAAHTLVLMLSHCCQLCRYNVQQLLLDTTLHLTCVHSSLLVSRYGPWFVVSVVHNEMLLDIWHSDGCQLLAVPKRFSASASVIQSLTTEPWKSSCRLSQSGKATLRKSLTTRMTIRKTFESAEGHHCHRGHERVLGDSLLFKGPVTKRNVLVARIKRENSDERFTYRHTRIRTGRWSLRTASRSHQANITIFTSL